MPKIKAIVPFSWKNRPIRANGFKQSDHQIVYNQISNIFKLYSMIWQFLFNILRIIISTIWIHLILILFLNCDSSFDKNPIFFWPKIPAVFAWSPGSKRFPAPRLWRICSVRARSPPIRPVRWGDWSGHFGYKFWYDLRWCNMLWTKQVMICNMMFKIWWLKNWLEAASALLSTPGRTPGVGHKLGRMGIQMVVKAC